MRQNGAVLTSAALLLGFPPTAILSTLPMIAQLGGCGDVINFGVVNLSQLKGSWKPSRVNYCKYQRRISSIIMSAK